MSKLYDVTVLGGDDPGSWIAAAAFAAREWRVALILDQSPDPDLMAFPWLPLDLCRCPGLTREFGLEPLGAPPEKYAPDFQVIVGGRAVDMIADPESYMRGLRRDLGESSRGLVDLTRRLDREAQDFMEYASGEQSPFNELFTPDKRTWLNRLRKKSPDEPEYPVFHEWAGRADPLARTIVMSLVTAAVGSRLGRDVSVPQVALVWRFCRGLNRGMGSMVGLREQTSELIAPRGVVMEGEVEALIREGRRLHSLRLKGGAIIDTRLLIASRSLLSGLLDGGSEGDEDQRAGLQRTTYFYRIERSAVPESLASRSVVVHDLERPLCGDNLMVLVLSPRVPRRMTLALTMLDPPEGLDPEEVPTALASSLPWLNPEDISLDETRETLEVFYNLADYGLGAAAHSTPGQENVFSLPSETLPGWGPAGIEFSLKRLVKRCEDLIRKYKGRRI